MEKLIPRELLIRGKVVNQDGSARERYVLVRNGRIESVTRTRPSLSDDSIEIKTEGEEWIFPGLLDLHTHSTYNLLPLWSSSNAPYNNRFEWRSDCTYRNAIPNTHKKFNIPENRTLIALFSELQAVAGGTSIIQESTDLESHVRRKRQTLICRDTANPRDLLLDSSKRILSVIDFFKPDRKTGKCKIKKNVLTAYVKNRKKGTLSATLAHVAEGRSGVGSRRGVDSYTREEFELFMRRPEFRDAAAVRSSPFSIIHGCGIDTQNSKHMAFLRERNISIVWSPVSNLLLYGDTLDVDGLIQNGINVALGSDWSPSGSKHVWDEAKFARFYLDAIGSSISDVQIFNMVTTRAANCLGLANVGRITPGAIADFFILRSPIETDNPLEAFFSTTDRHVQAMMIGGQPIYGNRNFLKKFKIPLQRLPKQEGSAVSNKRVYLPDTFGINLQREIFKIETSLKALDPPIKRSNLLSSSDKLYQRRIQFLKSSVTQFGWSVRQWRQQEPSKTPGRVPVSPNSVRVWRGFRKCDMKPTDFGNEIGKTFIPFAVQSQVPLGMTAYLPTILPYDKPASVPDEIALVFYESNEVYLRTFGTTVGRAYGLLHQTIFEPTSNSKLRSCEFESKTGTPNYLGRTIKSTQAYYLFKGKNPDWQKGTVQLLVALKKDGITIPTFTNRVYRTLKKIQKSPPEGLDGAIIVLTKDYLIYWEHWAGNQRKEHSGFSTLLRNCNPILNQEAEKVKIEDNPFAEYFAPDAKGGECLNLQFVRRRELLY